MVEFQAPQQMFAHALDWLKGWPSQTAVDKTAKVAASQLTYTDPVPGGRCVHLNTSGEFELGAQATQMPMFLIQGSRDYDVSNPGSGGADDWTAHYPAGESSALVAVGGYELETTEFYDGTYAINQLLKAPTQGQLNTADKGNAGKLANDLDLPDYASLSGSITLYTHAVCGVVSHGKALNHNRRYVIGFWPVYLPATTH